MKLGHSLCSALATGALLAAALPSQAASIPVYSYANGDLNCPTFSCSASVPMNAGNLIASTPAGFQSLGFNTVLVHNWDTGNPAGPATFSISGLPAHTSVNLGFLLAIIDSWDGNTNVAPDYFNITVDGVSIFSETFDNFDVSDQTASISNQLSFGSNLGFNSWNDSAYDFTGNLGFLNITHTASSLTVRFFASGDGWQGGTDESFGLDKIAISINVPNGVPEPGTLALLGLGIAGLAAFHRRRKQ